VLIGRWLMIVPTLLLGAFDWVRAATQRWWIKFVADWRTFRRWLALAAQAKGDQQHMEMAMHQSLLGASILNPFKLISALLGAIVLALSGALFWQTTRVDVLEARSRELAEKNRTAVRSSWAWKGRAEANARALEMSAQATIQDGRTRITEGRRSTTLTQTQARRSAALAQRQRERTNDAFLVQTRSDDAPVDLDRRLRDLAAPAGSSGGDPGAAEASGDPAAGVPDRAAPAASADAATPAAGAPGIGEDPPRGGILGSARPPG
jgi:hypothetical protein